MQTVAFDKCQVYNFFFCATFSMSPGPELSQVNCSRQ